MKHSLVACIIILVLLQAAALAQVPPFMNYQGVLTDAGGQAVSDGVYSLTFRIYTVDAGGTAIWEEIQAVTASKGIFNAALGAITPLDIPFDNFYWLGISVEGGEELAPRIQLTSSAYAFTARNVQDSTVTSAKLVTGAVTGEKIADGQVVRNLNGFADDVNIVAGSNIVVDPMSGNIIISATGSGNISGTGAAGQVAFWDDVSSISGNDWLFWNSIDRHLGIGTPNPNARLRVDSDEPRSAIVASTHQSDTTQALRAMYLGGGLYDATAVYGQSRPADGYGIGGDFMGGHKGLVATGNGGNHDRYIYGLHARAFGSTAGFEFRYGVWATADGQTTGNNLGVVGEAFGDGSANVGIYGHAEKNDGDAYGVYGEATGTPVGSKVGVFGTTFLASDSIYAGYFDGNLVYTGSLYKPSDLKLKTNLQPCRGTLDRVLRLEPMMYRYKAFAANGEIALPRGEHYGLVAQEVERVFPELVGDLVHPARPSLRGEERGQSFGYKAINYTELIPILVQAIKEQQEMIERLEARITELETR